MNQYIKFQIQSCGTTIDIVSSATVALDIYTKCVGPSVQILGQDSFGNCRVLQSKTRGLKGYK